ncbi:MAG: hypothetical protein SF029_22485, partial [bacterium]|nr:hypothetical protein [bacterium]
TGAGAAGEAARAGFLGMALAFLHYGFAISAKRTLRACLLGAPCPVAVNVCSSSRTSDRRRAVLNLRSGRCIGDALYLPKIIIAPV